MFIVSLRNTLDNMDLRRSLLTLAGALLVFLVIMGGRYFYLRPKYQSGDKPAEFSGTLITGRSFSLTELRGKYVLLDFWGSWCGPCRKENPSIAALQKEMSGKSFGDAGGFEVVSIGLEKSEAFWQKAIRQDGLDWEYHLMDPGYFTGPLANKFGVREIPTKYFLGPDGMILMVNPGLSELRSYLMEKQEN